MLADALRRLEERGEGHYSQVLKEQTSVRTSYEADFNLRADLEMGALSVRPIAGAGTRYDFSYMAWRGKGYLLWSDDCWLDVSSLDVGEVDDPELRRSLQGPGPSPIELLRSGRATSYRAFNRDLVVRVPLAPAVELLGGDTVVSVGVPVGELAGTAPVHVLVTDGLLRSSEILGSDVRSELRSVPGVAPEFMRYLADTRLQVRFMDRPYRELRKPRRSELASDAQSGCAVTETT